MKKIKTQKFKNPFKKLFIKLCRFMGYEIIDQSSFYVPTADKNLNQILSKAGEKSINLPLGVVKISRKINSLDVFIRTCSSVNMLTQSKKRIFEKDKIEYTLTSIKIHSLLTTKDLTLIVSSVSTNLLASLTRSWDDFIFMILFYRLL